MQHQSLDVSQPTPRVNASLMGRYVGKRVKLVGTIAGVNDGVLTLRAADEGTVQVQLNGPAPTEQFIEFEGTVESPNLLREESHLSFGENFDMSNYNEVCKLSCCEFAALFGAN